MLKNLVALAIVLLASIFTVQHYLTPGLPGTDDGIWAPVRLGSMYRELRQGQFPVRWSSDLNFSYGYPLFHFSYPGVYYLGSVILLAGFGLVNTVKFLFVAGVVFAAVGSYFLVRSVTSSTVLATCAALLYCSSPYLMTNLYRRGSIGEILAAGILPWILFVLYLSIKKHTPRTQLLYLTVASVLIAALILTHNVTALLSLPFIVLFILWQSTDHAPKSIITTAWKPLSTIVGGLLMSSFFWLPALLDVQYTKIAGHSLTRIEEWFASPTKTLFYPYFATASPDNLDDYRLSIGIVTTILLVLMLVLARHRKGTTFWFSGILVSIFMLFPISALIWKTLPIYRSIDFPWRMLTPLSICLPLGIAALASTRKYLIYPTIAATLIAVVLAVPWIKQRDILTWPDSQYATNQATATANNEYISKWSSKEAQSQPAQKLRSLNSSKITYLAINERSIVREYLVNAEQSTTVEYALMYFPGWQLTLNEQSAPINYTQNGLVQFDVPAGESRVKLAFTHTPLRLFTEVISLSTFIVLFVLLIRNFFFKRKVKSVD